MTFVRSFCYLILISAIFYCIPVASQNSWDKPKGIIFGTSLTYRWDDMEGPSFKIVYQDLTWNLNAAVYIQKKWRVGLSSLQVFEKNNTDDWENFFMAGPMIQYDIWPASKSPIVLETGVYYGNFAPVTGDLLKRDHTYFFNLGFSGEISLGKQWYLDIGGNFYPVLGQIKGKENFILYNIGINYFLGRR